MVRTANATNKLICMKFLGHLSLLGFFKINNLVKLKFELKFKKMSYGRSSIMIESERVIIDAT